MKKVFIGGLLAALVFFVVNFVVGGLTSEMYRTSPAILWKPMGGDWFIKIAIFYVILGLVLAKIFSVIKSGIPGSGIQQGLVFGAIVWAICSVQGLGMTYLTMNVRDKLILVWALTGLANFLLAGAVIKWADEKAK